jgi:hypothetical protein
MKRTHRTQKSVLTLLAISASLFGCGAESEPGEESRQDDKQVTAKADNKQPAKDQTATPAASFMETLSQAVTRRVPFGRQTGVYLEVDRDLADATGLLGAPALLAGRLNAGGFGMSWPDALLLARPRKAGTRKRVLVETTVCLKQGYLEHLMSRGGKQHESVIWAEVDASVIHAALLAAGARPGRPVQFRNVEEKRPFRPATGERIRILLRYEVDGKVKTVPAQQWVRYAKTKKPLDRDWLFAGSYHYKDPDGNVHYAANDGRYICLTNFNNALLDVPFESPDGDPQHGLDFEANPDAIPALETKVLMILEPTGIVEGK